jgi:5-methylcytosine-specific restriction endonuclease McrA
MIPRPVRNKPCHVCGTPSPQGACPPHRVPRPTYKQQQRRKQTVEGWIAQHGYMCPGHLRHYHYVDPGQLEADHIIPRSKPDGPGEDGPLSVLCKSCNSSKRDLS